jgi:hypothetical protein
MFPAFPGHLTGAARTTCSTFPILFKIFFIFIYNRLDERSKPNTPTAN